MIEFNLTCSHLTQSIMVPHDKIMCINKWNTHTQRDHTSGRMINEKCISIKVFTSGVTGSLLSINYINFINMLSLLYCRSVLRHICLKRTFSMKLMQFFSIKSHTEPSGYYQIRKIRRRRKICSPFIIIIIHIAIYLFLSVFVKTIRPLTQCGH